MGSRTTIGNMSECSRGTSTPTFLFDEPIDFHAVLRECGGRVNFGKIRLLKKYVDFEKFP